MIAAERRPSAVLIINPTAGRLAHSYRDEVLAALRSELDVEPYWTTSRDIGTKIARDAATAGVEVVIAFGGDGHVNEVVNGLAGSATALGIVPGGTMNVFARALGIPGNPVDAVVRLLDTWNDEPRSVPLGLMNERYFTFSGGCGFDAEAAERVERDTGAKRRFGEAFFYWSAFRVLMSTYRHRSPSMILRGPWGEMPVAMAVACNAGPYAYLAGRPIELAPEVRLEGGLDVFALEHMRIEALPFYAWRSLISRDLVHHPDTFYASDIQAFEMTAEAPVARHADGEPLPPASSVRFSLARDVLRVKA